MGSPVDVATRKPLLSAVEKPCAPVVDSGQPTRTLGSSNCLNLHARFVVKTYANGECISYAAQLTDKQKVERLEQNGSSEINDQLQSTPEGGANEPIDPNLPVLIPTKKRGQHHQNGLTSYAKRCIRILGHQYQETINEPNSTVQSCSFSTFSFRRFLPRNDKEGKAIFRAMLERIRRDKGNIKYVWVAEKQEGKILANGQESYRLKHKQSVIHFHLMSPERFEMEWLNTAWNETVANHFLKTGQVGPLEWGAWMTELRAHNAYCKRLAKYERGQRGTKPRAPDKTTFLLTPNIIGVYDAGRYMAKYISKEEGKISGHLWGMDAQSKKLCKPHVTEVYFSDEYGADRFAVRLHNLIETTGEEMQLDAAVFTWHDFYGNLGMWCSDRALFAGCYAQLLEPTLQQSSLPKPVHYEYNSVSFDHFSGIFSHKALTFSKSLSDAHQFLQIIRSKLRVVVPFL